MSRRPAVSLDLPPERGQTLAVTLAVAVASLPLARYVVWQVTVFAALMLALRLAALRWPRALPGRGALFALTLVGILNCLVTNQSIAGNSGGTALLITMVALKLLELQQRRDHRIVAIVLPLLAVVQFLYGQGPGLTLFLAAIVLTAVALLVELNGGLGERPARAALRITAALAVQALPLTMVLFLLFPRLDAPLWDLGADPETGVMGLGESMEPGSISELVVNGDLAFRARFRERPPAPERLYWRGLVLWEVNDSRWTMGRFAAASGTEPQLRVAADVVSYEVTLDASQRPWLFALDLAVDYPPDAILDRSFQLTSIGQSPGTRRYRAVSALTYRTADPAAAERHRALRLPPTVTPRQRALAAEWAASASSDWDVVEAGLAHFAEEEFRYTLLPPRLRGNVWDEFIFDSRSGFCEHYAGSFAVMMRLAGIPARVVVGYLGGEANRIGGHLMIWQSDAHAWVEVAITGRGWVRVDPTQMVAASRIDRQGAVRLLGAQAPARFRIGGSGLGASMLRQVRDLADAVDSVWEGWVLEFSSQRQLDLLERVGLESHGYFALIGLMLAAATLATGSIVWALIRQPRPPDLWARGYALYCRRLAAVGLARSPAEGPSDFGERVTRTRPDLAEQVARITSLYVRNRYGPECDPDDAVRFRRAVRGFRPRGRLWGAQRRSGIE